MNTVQLPAVRHVPDIPGADSWLACQFSHWVAPQQAHQIVTSLNAAYALLTCRKLTFKKGTLPAKKLEEMGPVIKELK